jgi:hypothetical protein
VSGAAEGARVLAGEVRGLLEQLCSQPHWARVTILRLLETVESMAAKDEGVMMEIEDANGKPRSREDIEAALKYVVAEMIVNPMRMGASDTGPAVLHYMVIRELLLAELGRRSE